MANELAKVLGKSAADRRDIRRAYAARKTLRNQIADLERLVGDGIGSGRRWTIPAPSARRGEKRFTTTAAAVNCENAQLVVSRKRSTTTR